MSAEVPHPAGGRVPRRFVITLVVALIAATSAHANPFISSTSIGRFSNSSTAWGDYDNDGDMDLLVAGTDGMLPQTSLYRNNGAGSFNGMSLAPAVTQASVAWGDYDRDGALDILLTGHDGSVPVSKVLRSSGGANPTFTDIGASLQAVSRGAVAWGDYDGDGDLDILLTGMTGSGSTPFSRVYQNNNGSFTSTIMTLSAVGNSSVAWGDYDNDGDLDILLSGESAPTLGILKVYRNSGGSIPSFTEISAPFTHVMAGTACWGDYNGDGYLDILATGTTNGAASGGLTRIYRNNGGTNPTFAALTNTLPHVSFSQAAWVDVDLDDDLDIVLTGYDTGAVRVSEVYLNLGGSNPSFVGWSSGLTPVVSGAVAWGDADGDRDVDLVLTGSSASGSIARIYFTEASPNHVPVRPSHLSAQLVSGTTANFQWLAGDDDETQFPSYNLRIGTTSGGQQVMRPMSDANGYHRVAAMGNANLALSRKVTLPGPGLYYWSVQTVDGGYLGSPFAGEKVFGVQGYVDAGAGLTGVRTAAADWGDYDNDGDLDLALAGLTMALTRILRVYRNDGGAFVVYSDLEGLEAAAVDWGDFDRDGDLDLAAAGYQGSAAVTKVYINTGTGFADMGADLGGVRDAALEWGDYDNDGDLDLAVAGTTGSSRITRVYRNDTTDFSNPGGPFAGVNNAALSWGDYDADGDLDLVVAGFNGTTAVTTLYRNTPSGFVDASAGLRACRGCGVAWGDYDNDSDLDLALVGDNGAGLYRNDAGSLVLAPVALYAVVDGDVAWGDYDNDGDLDLVLCGQSASTFATRVFKNNGGTFSDAAANLAGASQGALAWGDYDGDRDLDLLVAGGRGFSGSEATVLYRNVGVVANTVPTAPGGLSMTRTGTVATFRWTAATDLETPAAGLSYNLRIGTTGGGGEIVPPMASATTGLRRLQQMGRLRPVLEWTMPAANLPENFNWSVQAIDAGFAGSPFATTSTVDVDDVPHGIRVPALAIQGENPFRFEAVFAWSLPRAGRVELDVFDVAGRRVLALVAGDQTAGAHTTSWRGNDGAGRRVAPGLYLVRLRAEGTTRTLRLLKLE